MKIKIKELLDFTEAAGMKDDDEIAIICVKKADDFSFVESMMIMQLEDGSNVLTLTDYDYREYKG